MSISWCPNVQARDAQDGTNKAFPETQAEENMDDEADTFVPEDRAVIGFDSPGDTGKAPSPSRDKHSGGIAFSTPLTFV